MDCNHRKAFISTKEHFGITNKALHELTGVAKSHISRFLNHDSSNMTTDRLDKLIDAMEKLEPGSKRYYCRLLLGESLVNTREAARNMSFKDMADMMSAMADALEAAGETELMVS